MISFLLLKVFHLSATSAISPSESVWQSNHPLWASNPVSVSVIDWDRPPQDILPHCGDAGGSTKGIFAQQSIREMARTGRTPQQVMSAAADAIKRAGFKDPWGADADHLKTLEDVRRTAEAGFVFFTIDPSDYVDRKSDDYGPN